MILAACIALGLGLRLASGRSFRQLADLRLRGEGLLLVLLCAQAALPILRLNGAPARVAFWAWLATFPILVGVAWTNRRQPGMVVLAAGLALNALVIALNGGMPVSEQAVAMLGSASVAQNISAGDFVHVAATTATRLVWLSDVIPIPGPPFVRSVASAGDCLLFVGVIACLAAASSAAPKKNQMS